LAGTTVGWFIPNSGERAAISIVHTGSTL
jgi:hypothetical protein